MKKDVVVFCFASRLRVAQDRKRDVTKCAIYLMTLKVEPDKQTRIFVETYSSISEVYITSVVFSNHDIDT